MMRIKFVDTGAVSQADRYLMMLCRQMLALIFYFSFSTPNFVARPEA